MMLESTSYSLDAPRLAANLLVPPRILAHNSPTLVTPMRSNLWTMLLFTALKKDYILSVIFLISSSIKLLFCSVKRLISSSMYLSAVR